MKTVPWTVGKGSQEEYAASVTLWSAFHDKLTDSNSNKIPPDLSGIMLLSQLYGRAKDLCKKLPESEIQSASRVLAVVDAVYKRDTFSAVSDVYHDFIAVIDLKPEQNEAFPNFESRFEAQVDKFNLHCFSSQIPEALTALILLANANVDSSQHISVPAAAAPAAFSSNLSDASTTEDYRKEITYASIGSVLRQCDKSSTVDSTHSTLSSLHAISAPTCGSPPDRSGKLGKEKLSPEEFRDLKRRLICRTCKKKGRWPTEHLSDGSLKPGTPVSEPNTPKRIKNGQTGGSTVTFNTVALSS